MSKKVLTVAEALVYQKEQYGCVVLGRDALYAIARAQPAFPVVKKGTRIFFPVSTIDGLVSGTIQIPREQ